MTAEDIECLKIIKLIAVDALKGDRYDQETYKLNVKISRGIVVLWNLIKKHEVELEQSGIQEFLEDGKK